MTKNKKHKEKYKKNNVDALKKDLNNFNTDDTENFEENEREMVNKYARELFADVEKYSKKLRMTPSYFYYHMLYHLKQVVAFNVFYGDYKNINNYTTDEIAKNQGEMIQNLFPELGLVKKKNPDNKSKKLH
tara:strand:+ start:991 stop:1383 length:393 start_codon:yes stop_codon:yes gene_type:complete